MTKVSPTGRILGPHNEPNIQGLPIRTPEVAAIRKAFIGTIAEGMTPNEVERAVLRLATADFLTAEELAELEALRAVLESSSRG